MTVLFGGAPAVAVVDERRIIDGRGRVMRTLLVGEDRLDAKCDPDLTEPCIRAVERPALRQLGGLSGQLGGGDGGVMVGLARGLREHEREVCPHRGETAAGVEVVNAGALWEGLLHAAAVGPVVAQAGPREHGLGLAVDVLEVDEATLVIVVMPGDRSVLTQERVHPGGAEVCQLAQDGARGAAGRADRGGAGLLQGDARRAAEGVELAQLLAAIRVAERRCPLQVVDVRREGAAGELVVAQAAEAVEAARHDLVARARLHEAAERVVLVAVLWDRCAAGAGLGLEGRQATGGVEGVGELGAVGTRELRQATLRVVVRDDLPAVREGQGPNAAEHVVLELRHPPGRVRRRAGAAGEVELLAVDEVQAAGVEVLAHRLAEQAEAVAGDDAERVRLLDHEVAGVPAKAAHGARRPQRAREPPASVVHELGRARALTVGALVIFGDELGQTVDAEVDAAAVAERVLGDAQAHEAVVLERPRLPGRLHAPHAQPVGVVPARRRQRCPVVGIGDEGMDRAAEEPAALVVREAHTCEQALRATVAGVALDVLAEHAVHRAPRRPHARAPLEHGQRHAAPGVALEAPGRSVGVELLLHAADDVVDRPCRQRLGQTLAEDLPDQAPAFVPHPRGA